MFYDRMTRRLHLTVGGKEFLLALTLSGLEELESRSGKPIMDTMSGGSIPLSMAVDGFWIALRDGGNKKRYTRAEGEELAAQFMGESEKGFGSLVEVFMILMAISGILGSTARHETLLKAGLEDKDGEPIVSDNEKNEKTAGK